MQSWITPEIIALKREAIESIYHHRFTAYDRQEVFNPDTGYWEMKDAPIEGLIDLPCRVAKQLSEPTDERPREYMQRATLITAPEYDIPEGARIHVKYYNGIEEEYMQVSASRDYSDHQTLLMRKYKEGNAKYA